MNVLSSCEFRLSFKWLNTLQFSTTPTATFLTSVLADPIVHPVPVRTEVSLTVPLRVPASAGGWFSPDFLYNNYFIHSSYMF